MTFDRPPPGTGLTTVIETVPAEAISEAGTAPVSCVLFTKVVGRAAPLKSTVAPRTKPAPLTVRLNAVPPGEMLTGTNGWLMNGIGFPGGMVAEMVMSKG